MSLCVCVCVCMCVCVCVCACTVCELGCVYVCVYAGIYLKTILCYSDRLPRCPSEARSPVQGGITRMGRPRGGGSTGSYGLRRRSGVNPMLYNTGQELMMECVEEALSPSQVHW